jgi:predicted GNAT family acetyltransferase
MRLLATTDAGEVHRLAVAAVSADPLRHTVFGSIAMSAGLPALAPFAMHPPGADLPLVVRSHPQLPVQVTVGWDADLDQVAAALEKLRPRITALSGPVDTVADVAAQIDRPITERSLERLFRLAELIEPAATDGYARLAEEGDFELLTDWFRAFSLETFGRVEPELEEFTRNRIASSRTWIWFDRRRQPCSMAARHPVTFGSSRIGPVYTLPDYRGHGYGSAVTVAATRDVLDADALPCLFTRQSNATSNKIYPAIGYTAVMDRLTVRFG